MALVETLIESSWPIVEKKNRFMAPFHRITYQNAMHWYGSDKPDLRHDMKITKLVKNCYVLVIPQEYVGGCLFFLARFSS